MQDLISKCLRIIKDPSFTIHSSSSSSFHKFRTLSKGNPPDEQTIVLFVHEPAYKLTNSSSTSPPSISQILTQDTSRVNSINSRIASNSAKNITSSESSQSTTLPAKSAISLGNGNYIVTVGLGTPKKDLSLAFDTGSDFTWTQCQPCAGACHNQREPIFDPSQSSHYVNVSCNTPPCNQLNSATRHRPVCDRSNNCIYQLQYADKSFTAGYLAKDTLTISPTEIIADFYFGCGQLQNQGTYGQTAGLIGLGRDPLSIVSQTKAKYGQVFSYCLPSRSSGIGYLNFGKTAVSNAVQYIPFSRSQDTTLYYIDITEIYVGNRKVPISPTVFSTGGSIIDSGTVITRLPSAAYTSLRDTFKEMMSMYPLGKPVSLFDTCYDFSSYKTVKIPSISFVIGGKKIDIDGTGVMIGASSSQVCFGFAPNSMSGLTVFGNLQQKRMQVVYDVAGGKIGFGSNGCA